MKIMMAPKKTKNGKTKKNNTNGPNVISVNKKQIMLKTLMNLLSLSKSHLPVIALDLLGF
jgi:hypothetical protein